MTSVKMPFTYWIERETQEGRVRSRHVDSRICDIIEARPDHAGLAILRTDGAVSRQEYAVLDARFYLPVPNDDMLRAEVLRHPFGMHPVRNFPWPVAGMEAPASFLRSQSNDYKAYIPEHMEPSDPYAGDVLDTNYGTSLARAEIYAACLAHLEEVGLATCHVEPIVGQTYSDFEPEGAVMQFRDTVAGWRDPLRSTGLARSAFAVIASLIKPRHATDQEADLPFGRLAATDEGSIPMTWRLDPDAIAIADGITALSSSIRANPALFFALYDPSSIIDLIEMDVAIRDLDRPPPDLREASKCFMAICDEALSGPNLLYDRLVRNEWGRDRLLQLKGSVENALETYAPEESEARFLLPEEAEAFEALLP